MVPGCAAEGEVPPQISRTVRMASGPSSTRPKTGPMLKYFLLFSRMIRATSKGSLVPNTRSGRIPFRRKRSMARRPTLRAQWRVFGNRSLMAPVVRRSILAATMRNCRRPFSSFLMMAPSSRRAHPSGLIMTQVRSISLTHECLLTTTHSKVTYPARRIARICLTSKIKMG